MALRRCSKVTGWLRTLLLAAGVLEGTDLRAHACSYVEIPVKDGNSKLIARTMEYWDRPDAGNWQAVFHPKGTVMNNQIAFLSVDTGDADIVNKSLYESISEGMNELGFTISSQTLQMSEYQAVQDGAETVWHTQLPQWALGRFPTVAEFLDALPTVRVCNPAGLPTSFGSHWAVADAAGSSAIVEYLHGQLVVHNNSVGVMTNDPHYEWHLLNLNSFSNLRPTWPDTNAGIQMPSGISAGFFNGMVPQPIGHGWNLAGLPGDFSPPSRFARLFFLRQYSLRAKPVNTTSDAVIVATGMLNNVFIPQGAQADVGQPSGYEYTPYAVMKVPSERLFFYRTAHDMTWKKIDMTLLTGSQTISIPLGSGLGIQDVTEKLHPTSGHVKLWL